MILSSNYTTDWQQGVRHYTIPHQEKPPITLVSKLDLVTKMHQVTLERTSKGSRFHEQFQDEHVDLKHVKHKMELFVVWIGTCGHCALPVL